MPRTPPRHQWVLRFDREVCRDCNVPRSEEHQACTGPRKIRPMATMRLTQTRQLEERA